MVAPGHEIMSDIGTRAVAIDGRFFVKEGFYNATIIDYDCGFRTEFERKDRTVFLGPFRESGSVSLASVDISSMHQVSYHTGNGLQLWESDEGFQ